jgi:hypothetical protein
MEPGSKFEALALWHRVGHKAVMQRDLHRRRTVRDGALALAQGKRYQKNDSWPRLCHKRQRPKTS